MIAGKQLDKQVATQVLGHSVVQQKNRALVEGTPRGQRPLASYSTEIGAAWEVAEHLGITLIPIEGGTWFAMAGKENGWTGPAEFIKFLQTAEFMNTGAAVAETAPLAICLAAIKVVEKRAQMEMPATAQAPHAPHASGDATHQSERIH
jgi:hypothetical protein